MGTVVSFLLGSGAALALGLMFVMHPKLEKALDLYLMVLNAMPRFALAPLFLLWFGLGIGSKIERRDGLAGAAFHAGHAGHAGHARHDAVGKTPVEVAMVA